MFNSLTTLAAIFSAVASAAPVAQSSPAPTSDSFGMLMQVLEVNQTLSVYYNTTSNLTVLVGSNIDPSFGSKFFTTGVNPNETISTVIDGETYGLWVSDVGEVYGLVENVGVTENYEDPHWSVNNGFVFHKLYAASNLFMACNRTVGDDVVQVLSFGVVDDNGSVPAGCYATSIYQC